MSSNAMASNSRLLLLDAPNPSQSGSHPVEESNQFVMWRGATYRPPSKPLINASFDRKRATTPSGSASSLFPRFIVPAPDRHHSHTPRAVTSPTVIERVVTFRQVNRTSSSRKRSIPAAQAPSARGLVPGLHAPSLLPLCDYSTLPMDCSQTWL